MNLGRQIQNFSWFPAVSIAYSQKAHLIPSSPRISPPARPQLLISVGFAKILEHDSAK